MLSVYNFSPYSLQASDYSHDLCVNLMRTVKWDITCCVNHCWSTLLPSYCKHHKLGTMARPGFTRKCSTENMTAPTLSHLDRPKTIHKRSTSVSQAFSAPPRTGVLTVAGELAWAIRKYPRAAKVNRCPHIGQLHCDGHSSHIVVLHQQVTTTKKNGQRHLPGRFVT